MAHPAAGHAHLAVALGEAAPGIRWAFRVVGVPTFRHPLPRLARICGSGRAQTSDQAPLMLSLYPIVFDAAFGFWPKTSSVHYPRVRDTASKPAVLATALPARYKLW